MGHLFPHGTGEYLLLQMSEDFIGKALTSGVETLLKPASILLLMAASGIVQSS